MSIVAGVDFGTLSVRVTLVDSQSGPLGTASASYPLHRRRDDPNYATQAHSDQMTALAAATRDVLKTTGIAPDRVEAIALDTTGSSVIPVGETSSRSTSITCGAIIAHLLKRKRSPPRRMPSASKALNGAAASTPTSGASPSFCIGFATIQKNATAS